MLIVPYAQIAQAMDVRESLPIQSSIKLSLNANVSCTEADALALLWAKLQAPMGCPFLRNPQGPLKAKIHDPRTEIPCYPYNHIICKSLKTHLPPMS